MKLYKVLTICIAAAVSTSCTRPHEVGGTFGAPVGIRMEASSASPAFEMAVAANTPEFPQELVSPFSSAMAKALKQCPPPTTPVISLNLTLQQDRLGELEGSTTDADSRCLMEALKGQRLATTNQENLQLMAQLRFEKP